MLVSSLVIFLMSIYGVEKLKFPFFSLESQVDQNFIYYGVLGFSIFSITSFIVRSQYEKDLWPRIELSRQSEIKRFESDFKKIISQYKILDRVESLSSLSQHEAIEYSNKLTELDYHASLFLSELSEQHEENGVLSPVHPKFWRKAVKLFAEVVKQINFLSSLVEKFTAPINGMVVKSEQEAHLKGVQSTTSLALAALDAAKPEISERISKLRLHSFYRWFQTYFLSVYVPVIVSILLVVFSFIGIFSILQGS